MFVTENLSSSFIVMGFRYLFTFTIRELHEVVPINVIPFHYDCNNQSQEKGNYNNRNDYYFALVSTEHCYKLRS